MQTSQAIPDSHFASLSKLESGYWWYVARVRWASRWVRQWKARQTKPTSVYADLGCGTGGFAKALQEEFRFSKVILVDADPNALKRIQFPGADVVATQLDGNLRLSASPQLISLMDVIEHLDDDRALLNRAAHILSPGGLLLLSVPAHSVLFSSWDTHLGHRRRYEKRDLIQMVQNAGLKLIELRPMWTPLFFLGLVRKFQAHDPQRLEFPAVSPLINRLLLKLSDWEFALPRWAQLPFGTSWILCAEKI